jgi:ATP synthase F1 delta subunit
MTASGFDDPIINFILMIARHNRLQFMEKIFSSFKEIHLTQQNSWPIHVKSAGPVDAKDNSYLDVLRSILEKVYGTNVKTNYSVDPNLIAGFQIITSDKIIDGSLKKQLTLLKKFT